MVDPGALIALGSLAGPALAGRRRVDLETGPRPAPARPGHHDLVHPGRDLPGEPLVALVDRIVEGALQVHNRPDR